MIGNMRSQKPISPVKRARLEETFKRASKKATTPQDFDFAAELLAQCVIGDPGNPAYVRAYLENLHKKFLNNKKSGQPGWFKDRTAQNALKKALAERKWDEAVRHGLDVLKGNPWDVPTLTQMATAARESGDNDSQLCYLKAALTKEPKDPTCNRMAAIALDEMGLVNQAIVFWQRVLAALPKDKQAQEAISAFQVGAKGRGTASSQRLTAQEQEEIVRQREIQQQEEQARQQKIREEERLARQREIEEEEKLARQQEVEEQTTPEAANATTSPTETEDKLPRMPGTAEAVYQEGYDYGVEAVEVPQERKKIDPFTLAVVGIVWLVMMGIVVAKWGATMWKYARWPWWAWIVLGVVMLVVAMMLSARKKS